jgi:hypothetical protein
MGVGGEINVLATVKTRLRDAIIEQCQKKQKASNKKRTRQ